MQRSVLFYAMSIIGGGGAVLLCGQARHPIVSMVTLPVVDLQYLTCCPCRGMRCHRCHAPSVLLFKPPTRVPRFQLPCQLQRAQPGNLLTPSSHLVLQARCVELLCRTRAHMAF
jgi:hypothetical protein